MSRASMGMGELREKYPDHPLVKEADARAAADCELAGEAKLQADCEKWLVHHGYWPQTPDRIKAGPPPKGWYMHIPQLKDQRRMPVLLDLLIRSNDGHWLEPELKTATGRVLKHQQALIDQNPTLRPLCRSLPELIEAVTAWEEGINRRQRAESAGRGAN
jgi:hypothetical protein